MIQTPNYEWSCPKCGKEITGHIDDSVSPASYKCPKCGGKMKGQPGVPRPLPSDEWKKY